MKWFAPMAVVLVVAAGLLAQPGVDRKTGGTPVPQGVGNGDQIRFDTVDVFIDSGATPLAAWQVEFTPARPGAGGKVTLVGIEGGEHAAFGTPAKYDPAALAPAGGGRVILAAFSTMAADQLPRGRTRVARLHVYVEGPGEVGLAVVLRVAADAEGRTIKNAAATAALMGDER